MAVNMNKMRQLQEEKRNSSNRAKNLIVTEDGDDVVFAMKSDKVGHWYGERTSVMATDHEGRKLLRWLLGKDFDRRALEIIADQLNEANDVW